MSSINFRIYGDQIYGFSSKYLTEYISPEITKEDFLNQFSSGKLSYDNVSIKKIIQINPQISLSELNIEKLDINIPSETENLSMYLNNIKTVINLSDINDEEIEKLIINERKGLIDKFIDFAIKKVEKKESSKSFLEGLIENLVNRAIDGLSLDLNNIELVLKYKKNIFIFIIEKISYSENNGIQINNVSLLLEEDLEKKNIINKFSINVEINPDDKINKIENGENKEENKEENDNENNENNNDINNNNNTNVNKENENKKNKLNITMTNFEFILNQNVFLAFNDIYNLFNQVEYQKIFLRYKYLIQFHKPKPENQNLEIAENTENNENNNTKKNMYLSQWYYAIKTVIKLQKYIGYQKDYIFDLIESSQIKIAKKYLEDNSNTTNLLLPTEINLLKATKDKVEKQLLENKKGGGLTKAFSFFFGGGGDDENKELTEEEKNDLNNIYTDEYIIKYLLGLTENKNNSSNPLSQKIDKFINNVSAIVNVEKIELVLINLNEKENNNKCNLFIKDINLNINLVNKNFDFEMNINDIGTLLNESLFNDRLDNVNYLIQVKKEPNNELIKLNLGFNNIILNEQIFIFILTYFYSLNIPHKIKLFHKIDYSSKINKNENKENEDSINNNPNNTNDNKDSLSVIDNFSISHIPSLTLLNSDNNRIELNLKNGSFTKNNLNFTTNIQDSFGTILDDYTFNFHREKDGNKQKFKFYLEEPLNITLSKNSSFFIFVTYLKLIAISKKIKKNSKIKKNEENKDNIENEGNDKNANLFCFNYVEHKNVDIDFNNICLDIKLNDINIQLNEKKCSSFLSIKNLILKYENKDLFLKTEKIEVNTDYLSTIILYLLNLKSKDFKEYEKLVEDTVNINDDIIDKDNVLIQIGDEPQVKDNLNNITTNYNIKISDIFTSLKLEIELIVIAVKIEGNIIVVNISNIQGKNNIDEQNIITISLNDINLYIEKSNNLKEKFNVLNMNKTTLVNYYLENNLFKIKIDSPILNIFKSIFISIFNNIKYIKSIKSIKYIKDQKNILDVDVTKYEIEIINTSVKFSSFNFNINSIYVSNFDGKSTYIFFLKINGFLMKNEKNLNIIEEKELELYLTTKSKNEDYLYAKLNVLEINISQHDISFLVSLLETSEKDEEQKLNNSGLYRNNINLISKNSESLLILEGDKDSNLDINDHFNNLDNNKQNNKIEKEHIMQVECEAHKINIGFCLDDYTKKSNLNIENTGLKLKNSKIKNNETDKMDNLTEYNFFIDRITLKYFDDYNNEIIILNYNKEEKKGFKVNTNNENKNQIEIISKKDFTTININRNEIIIRIDCFLMLYYFFMKALPMKDPVNDNNQNNFSNILDSHNDNIIIKNNNILKRDLNNNILRIHINFNKTKFQLQTSFDGKEILNLIIDDFSISYNPLESKNNYTNLNYSSFSQNDKNEEYPTNIYIKLGYISASIISEKNSKELFYSEKEFINVKCGINEKIIDIDSNLGVLVINISYQDLITFLKAYLLNKILIENIKSLSQLQSQYKDRKSFLIQVGTMVENKKSSNIKAKLHFSKIDFTLVDNSYGSYQPFLNGNLNKISLNYNYTKEIECSYNLLLFSYNYISCKWEPIIENLFTKLKCKFKLRDKNSENNINVDINEIIMNLSDMAISSTLIILQHWLEKFPEDEKRYSKIRISNNNVIQFKNEIDKKTKISNNTIINYSGINLNIKYNKNEFKLEPQSQLELEYINDWDISKRGYKKISVSINNKNNNNLNQKNSTFNIFIDKLGIYEHYFNNNNFLIAENTLSKDRRINISIYSQIIIKNKTFDNLQIKLINQEIGNSFILLKSNSIIGIPLNYNQNDTYFSINLINKNNLNNLNNQSQNNIRFKLKDILEVDDFCEAIYPENKVFYVKLIKKLNNLKEILITFQYSIVNCLPCDLIIENQKEKKSITIKKFTQHFIDYYSDINTELIFKIKIGNEYFYSINTKYFNMAKKKKAANDYYTIFYNENKTQSFKLSLQYNKTKNIRLLMIYSEYILYNDSGIDFNIISKNENSPLCFNIGNKMYLISSQIEDIKNVWMQLKNDKFISNQITLDDIIEAKPFYNLKLENNSYKLNLIIKTMMSYISIRNNPNFKENIMTMIYKIYPICRITNLLTSKNILICEENNKNNYIIINSLRQVNFNFFEKGRDIILSIGLLNFDDNKCSPLLKFKLSAYGIFTFCIEDTLFNIEVKDSTITGIIDIFIIDTNLNNAKIIIENLSNKNFTAYQDGYEQYSQPISQNEKQILKIYDQYTNDFIVRNNENNKSYRFNFISFKEEEHEKEINNIKFIKESNGMKMKLIILGIGNFNEINNSLMKLDLKIKIEKILISVIADNEFKNKKLRNYERNELLLLNLSQFKIEYNLEHYSGLLDNDKVNVKIFLNNFELYNQISKYGKFSCVCQNISNPTSYLESEMFNYKNSSMSKINKFVFKMGKLKLNIDPHFIYELINFFENILYRMEIINFNVDEIFLHRNRDFRVKKQLENYKKDNSICYGSNFSFPEIDINFEVTEIGLAKLLFEKANCSKFFVWLGLGLVGKEQNLFLNKPIINSHLGSFNNLIQKITLIYKDETSSEITNIGFKGLWGQIEHFFINIDKTDVNCIEVQKKRIRYPRAFYGKYKYFKIYNKDDAMYFDILENKYNFEKNGVYCNELVKGINLLFLFTNADLLIFKIQNYENICKVNFASIDSIRCEKENIITYFNEEGKKKNNCNDICIFCENNSIAEKVEKILNDKYRNISIN